MDGGGGRFIVPQRCEFGNVIMLLKKAEVEERLQLQNHAHEVDTMEEVVVSYKC